MSWFYPEKNQAQPLNRNLSRLNLRRFQLNLRQFQSNRLPDNIVLGKLSEKFETGGRGCGIVSGGQGDAGGRSYGSYQMTSKPGGGTVKRFISQPDFAFRDRFKNLTPGSDQFTAVWKDIAAKQPTSFKTASMSLLRGLTSTCSLKRF